MFAVDVEGMPRRVFDGPRVSIGRSTSCDLGDAARAELLRLQEQLAADPDLAQAARLRELAASIEVGWRYHVARPAVEGCGPRFSFQCPRDWAAMAETDQPDVRHCSACNAHVHYGSNVEQARAHAIEGECVVVDIISLRRPGDLEPPRRIRMGMMATPT